MKKGKLIVIEGCEGAGKGTVIATIKRAHPEFVFTREPGGTPLAEQIRNVILDKTSTASALTQLTCIFGARADHISKVILPSIEAGQTVICDRFDLSSYAYQVYAPKALQNEEIFLALRKAIIPDNLPIYYMILDIPANIGLNRKKQQDEEQLFETKPVEFHTLVREGFKLGLEKITANSKNVRQTAIINADEEKQVVAEQVLNTIKNWQTNETEPS